MTKPIEDNLEKIPIVNILVKFGKKIKIPGLEGMSLYDVLEMYILGIVRGALTTRAGGIAFSFFMAIFPFLLFILTLIPYIPIEGFQESLLSLIAEVLPPKTKAKIVTNTMAMPLIPAFDSPTPKAAKKAKAQSSHDKSKAGESLNISSI